MISNKKTVDFFDDETRDFLQYLKLNHQLDFTNYAPSSLNRRLQKVLVTHGFSSLEKIKSRLKKDSSFIEEFISTITVNVSEIFRDLELWKTLKHELYPSIKNKAEAFSFLHVGCSGGEEIVSNIILLNELKLFNNVTISGIDINKKVLETARNFKIKEKDTPSYIQKFDILFGDPGLFYNYFEKSTSDFKLKAIFQNKIKLSSEDILNTTSGQQYDFVFCRNLLIYFNPHLQNSIIAKLHQIMSEKAYLIIGINESLIYLPNDKLFVAPFASQKIYQKSTTL